MAFDRNGMLILPKETEEEFREKRKHNRCQKTGVFVQCWRCGKEWERKGRREGMIRCHGCGTRMYVEKIMEGEVR